MAQYTYTAVDKSGVKVKGTLDAPNESEVRVVLRAQQLRPIKIGKASALDVDLGKIGGFGGPKLADLILFTRQLSILVSSGIPLVQGLEIISDQMTSEDMKRTVLSLKEKITGGGFLWEAMAAYPKVFPPIYISMVRAGEAAGAMEIIFKRLIKYLDDSDKLKKMVRGAMIYPIAITLVGIVVVIIMMTFVIPKFEKLLQSSGQELPGPTQVVINISHFFQDNILFIVVGLVSVIYLIRHFLETDEGRRFFDYRILKVPLFGDIVRKVAIARFSRTMQTLLSSGINLLDGLDICKDAVGNKKLEEGLTKMRSEVEHGKTLSGVMSKLDIFTPMVVQMVTVGESTGNVDKMLERIAEFYEEEVRDVISNLSKMIEPLVLVFLGGAVGALMIAMYLPIFKMAGN